MSQQTGNKGLRERWQNKVREVARSLWHEDTPVSGNLELLAIYCHEAQVVNLDNDNWIKPVQDALLDLVYADDNQITDTHIYKRNIIETAKYDPISDMFTAEVIKVVNFIYVRVQDAPNKIEVSAMVLTPEILKERALRRTKQEYERDGYRVVVGPRDEDLPDFLRGFEPDIIGYSPRGNVVAQVKAHFEIVGKAELSDLARVVNAKKGWRMALVITGAKPPLPPIASPSEFAARVDEARQLLKIHQTEAAFLLGWSAAETALRAVARRWDIVLELPDTPHLLQSLVIMGGIDNDDKFIFDDWLDMRDMIVHGFESPELKPEVVTQLLDRAEQLYAEATSALVTSGG